MSKAIVYSQVNCPGCTEAKALLLKHNFDVEVRMLGQGWNKRDLLEDFPDAKSVPQIIIGDNKIGDIIKLRKYFT